MCLPSFKFENFIFVFYHPIFINIEHYINSNHDFVLLITRITIMNLSIFDQISEHYVYHQMHIPIGINMLIEILFLISFYIIHTSKNKDTTKNKDKPTNLIWCSDK